MDERLRRLERQVATGDLDALHRLLVEHLRVGLLKPIDPGIAEYKKKQAQEVAKRIDLNERCHPTKRMTAAQRKRARKLRGQRKRWGHHGYY